MSAQGDVISGMAALKKVIEMNTPRSGETQSMPTKEIPKALKPSELPRNEPIMISPETKGGKSRPGFMALVDAREPSFYEEPKWANFMFNYWEGMPDTPAVLMGGPRGSGKTLAAIVLAARWNRKLLVVNCNPEWTAFDLLATQRLDLKNHGGDYLIPGPIRIGAEHGAIVLFDEYNLYSPGTMAGMNSIADETQGSIFCPLSGDRINWKDPKLLFAVNEGYAGTREIQEAFRDRCVSLVAEYMPPEVETKILEERTKLNTYDARKAVRAATAIRKAASGKTGKTPLRFDMSPRALLHYGRMVACGMNSNEAWQIAVINRAGYTSASRGIRGKLVEISTSAGYSDLIVY